MIASRSLRCAAVMFVTVGCLKAARLADAAPANEYDAAVERGWPVHLYAAKDVIGQAAARLGARAGEVGCGALADGGQDPACLRRVSRRRVPDSAQDHAGGGAVPAPGGSRIGGDAPRKQCEPQPIPPGPVS